LLSATENKIQLENNLNKVGYSKPRQLLTKQKILPKPDAEGRSCCCLCSNRTFCNPVASNRKKAKKFKYNQNTQHRKNYTKPI
jgi:hypothetical protein